MGAQITKVIIANPGMADRNNAPMIGIITIAISQATVETGCFFFVSSTTGNNAKVSP